MKSIKTPLINRFFKSCFFKLTVIDFVLFLLFRYYQPLCEPCLDNDWEPCLSKEQYIIIYIGIAVNVIGFIVCIYITVKNNREKQQTWHENASHNSDREQNVSHRNNNRGDKNKVYKSLIPTKESGSNGKKNNTIKG